MQREMWICVVCKSSSNHPDACDMYGSSTGTSSFIYLSLIRPQVHQNDKQVQYALSPKHFLKFLYLNWNMILIATQWKRQSQPQIKLRISNLKVSNVIFCILTVEDSFPKCGYMKDDLGSTRINAILTPLYLLQCILEKSINDTSSFHKYVKIRLN